MGLRPKPHQRTSSFGNLFFLFLINDYIKIFLEKSKSNGFLKGASPLMGFGAKPQRIKNE
jgi:hypothetical protein